MYSQHHFSAEAPDHQFSPTPGITDHARVSSHTTVGAVPVARNTSYSFGAASIAMSPTLVSGVRPISFNDSNSQIFGTSMDSFGSFGQSPIFGGRDHGDLMVSPSTSTSQLDGLATGEEEDAQQRNLQEMFEKRRRRRESHNAVERRRRENINDRIHELCMLLPEHLLELAPASSNVMSVSTNQNGGNARAVNKGTVLKLSIDHIKELQSEVGQYRERVKELEHKIEYLKGTGHNSDSDLYNRTQNGDDSQYPAFLMQRTPHGTAHIGDSERERMNAQHFQRQFGSLHISPEELGRQS